MILTLKEWFTPEQCEEVISIYGGHTTPWRPSLRKNIATKEITLPWYIERIERAMRVANEKFELEITGLTDQPALVRYDEGCYFHWHHDMYSGREGVHRKFSLITILSKPFSHQGGDLEFFDHGVIDSTKPSQGTVFAFPAWVQHRVTKVTAGTRYSAVAFVGGPKLR